MKLPDTPTPGRPRDRAIDAAVLDATRALLAECGYGGFGIGTIASRAGTTRAAIYRRWQRKALIVLEAVFAETTVGLPDMGDMAAELRAAARGMAEQFNDPVARSAVGGLVADLSDDPELHSLVRAELLQPEHARVAAIFDRAALRGELKDDADPHVAGEGIGGAIVYRTCFVGGEADRAFVDSVVALVLRGTRKEDV